MDTLSNGKEAPSGPATITVEKHKDNFRTQYGTFSDKPSENITRWLEKAEAYQDAHMIPSLEMASIVIHSIKGEPQIKVQRMLEVGGDDYIHANHFKEQIKQEAVPYTKYKPRVPAKKEIKHPTTGVVTQEAEAAIDAEPAIMPVRYQPEVKKNQCLKFYLLNLYQKRLNLSDADKFLTTFKTQKPKQTCSNYLDEFAINFENYAHLKWSLKELNGVKHKAATGTLGNPDYVAEVLKVESNIETRKAEMLRLVTDGLCSEFKTHCDNTKFDLTTKTFIEIEKEVMFWQRSTTQGKKFTASCTPAKPTTTATVAAMEFDRYLDANLDSETQEESFTSSTQSSQSVRGKTGGRGSTRGNRGRGGRGRGASTGRPTISRDIGDGNHPNYMQTTDGQLKRSIHGFPLCNYCGTASHKRQNCPLKIKDRAAGKMRLSHPDREKNASNQDKGKQESAPSSAVMASPMGIQPTIQHQQHQQLWHYNQWPQHTSSATLQQPTIHDGQQLQQLQLGPIGSQLQDSQQKPAPTKLTTRHQPMTNPCPYPTCHAILADFNQTQEHINQFHTIPTLARGPGAEQ
jgi:hypothetical protein